jgi:hypothetical protein
MVRRGSPVRVPEEGLKYLQIDYFCCLLRHGAGEHYGGGQRGGDLQGFLPTPGLVLGTKGNREGKRALLFGRDHVGVVP